MRMIIVGSDHALSAQLLLGRSAVQHAIGCGIRCDINDFLVHGPRSLQAMAVPGIQYVSDGSVLLEAASVDTDVVISNANIVYEWTILLELLGTPGDLCIGVGASWPGDCTAATIDDGTLATIGLPVDVAGISGRSIGLLRLSARCARVALDNGVVTLDTLIQSTLTNSLTIALRILPRGWLDLRSLHRHEIAQRVERDDERTTLRRPLLAGAPVISAGGVARRLNKGRDEVLLVGDGAPGTWRIPKGMVEENESIEAAALREVAEETGYETALEEHIGTAHWSYEYQGIPRDELVHFYSLRVLRIRDSRDSEHRVVKWHSVNDALNAMQYEEERAILRKLCPLDGVEHVPI